MDSTPPDERASELADLDPADAVEPAQDLADELEASLVEPEPPSPDTGPDDDTGSPTPDPTDPLSESAEADAPPA